MDAKSEITPNKLSRGKSNSARHFLYIILILAGFGLLGGYWSIKTSIEQPLAFVKNSTSTSLSLTNTSTNATAAIEGLKNKDSDGDGLSDYDELNKYGTSPYLADSDSDGKTDKQEIDAKNDPNCPENTACTPIALFTPTFSGTNTNSGTNSAIDSLDNSNTNTGSTSNIDLAQLRTTLRNAGATQADLDAMSDADLLALYQSVVSEDTNTNTNASTNTNAATNVAASNANTSSNTNSSIDTSQLSNLTAAEIRQLLKIGGADEATLNSVDDATLKQIFLQSLQNVQ